MGLLNVLTVLNLCLNVGNPVWVGMLDPAYGAGRFIVLLSSIVEICVLIYIKLWEIKKPLTAVALFGAILD
jgi:hypothetical protein